MPTRPYNAVRRALSAEATRQRILDAALELFQNQGYQATTITQISTKAAASVNAIYSSIGGKPQLLIALISDVIQDATAAWDHAATKEAQSGRAALAATLTAIRYVLERHEWLLGELHNNASADPVIAVARAQGDADYTRRLNATIRRLDELGELRRNLSVERATDVAWFFFGFPPWQTLRAAGWDWQEAETWLLEQASCALIDGQELAREQS